MSNFDPYIEWLEIDPALCPPNFYDLLGIMPFESDAEKIERAFEKRLKHVRSFQTGPRGIYTQNLLNELTQARLCLLNDADRLAYDQSLRNGQAKPPVSIENLSGDSVPPVDANAIRIADPDSDEKTSTSNRNTPSSKSKRLKFSLVYAAICIAAFMVFWGIMNLTRGNSQSVAEENESETEVEKEEPPPKPIINVVEEKKGILPGANNSYSLVPSNATIDMPHPTVIDTTDGQLFDQWQPAKSEVRWEIWINTPGHYEAIVSYNATSNGKFSRIIVQADEKYPKKVKMRTAELSDRFFEEEAPILFRERGAHVLKFSVEGETGDFRLKSITVRPNRTTRN